MAGLGWAGLGKTQMEAWRARQENTRLIPSNPWTGRERLAHVILVQLCICWECTSRSQGSPNMCSPLDVNR